MKTIAEQLGQTPHLSPLLRRLRTFDLASPQALRRLAVARGCKHYRYADDLAKSPDPGPEQLSNLELAVAMVSGAQEFDPVLVRCAAQLLSGEGIAVERLARLAIQERAVPVIRHIARAAVEMDAGREAWWRQLLTALPVTPEVPEGRLPHRSRFVSQTGVRRLDGRLQQIVSSVWLRPVISQARDQ